MSSRAIISVAVLVLGPGGASWAASIRVPEDHPTVLAAVDAAVAGDSVLVGPGTWTARDTRQVSARTVTSCAFLKGGITLIGTAGADATVIDAQVIGTGTVTTVIYAGYPGSWVTLEGLTITGAGSGDEAFYAEDSGLVTLRSCKISGNSSLSVGTAIGIWYVTSPCDLVMEDCEVSFNVSTSTAGIRAEAGGLDLRRCRFEGNVGKGTIEFDGVSNGQDVIIEDCEFIGNRGVAVVLHDPFQVRIERNLFLRNVNPSGSGAGLIVTSCFGPVRDNVFAYDSTYGGYAGAGVYAVNFTGTMSTNTFVGCHIDPPYNGSAAYLGATTGTSLVFTNNLVSGCTGGGAIWLNYAPQVGCNAFWENGSGLGDYVPDPTDLFLDPQFCDPAALDFSLAESSPYTAANNPACGQIGALGEGCGPVSVESTSWGRIKQMYRREGEGR